MISKEFEQAQAFWNARYDQSDFIFGTQPNHYLVQVTEKYLTAPQRVLCVADGEGRNSVWLSSLGFDVVAFDPSDIALEKARTFAAQLNTKVSFNHSDCDSWTWKKDAFDVVVIVFTQFADPAMRERLFTKSAQTLKPGGMIIIQGYTPKQVEYKTGGPTEVINMYTPELMKELLPGFNFLEMTEYEKVMKEGSRHDGLSALIGLVAQKEKPAQ